MWSKKFEKHMLCLHFGECQLSLLRFSKVSWWRNILNSVYHSAPGIYLAWEPLFILHNVYWHLTESTLDNSNTIRAGGFDFQLLTSPMVFYIGLLKSFTKRRRWPNVFCTKYLMVLKDWRTETIVVNCCCLLNWIFNKSWYCT